MYYKNWSKKLNFTLDEKIKFVDHIRQRPEIWDRRKKECLDVDTVKECWEEVVDIYGGKELTHEQREEFRKAIQKKWRYMRDSYMKYVNKTGRYKKSGKSQYFESDLFTFLDVTFVKHPRKTNEDEHEEVEKKEEENRKIGNEKGEKKEEENKKRGERKDSGDIVSDLAEVEIGDDDDVTQVYVDDIRSKLKEKNVEEEGVVREENSNNEDSFVADHDDDEDTEYVGQRYLDDIREKLRIKSVERKGDAGKENSNKQVSSVANEEEKEKDVEAGHNNKKLYSVTKACAEDVEAGNCNKKLDSVTKACAEDVEARNDKTKLDSVTRTEDTRKRPRENSVQEEERVEKGKDSKCTTDESDCKRMKGNDDDSIVNNHADYSFDIVVVESHHSAEHFGVEDSSHVPLRNRLQRKSLTKVELDECDVFGKLVAVKLRKMDSHSRTRLQSMIFQTLFNAEQQQR